MAVSKEAQTVRSGEPSRVAGTGGAMMERYPSLGYPEIVAKASEPPHRGS